jgi:DegV family protein with EDD domain
MAKFIISVDTSADMYKDFMEKNKIHYLVMKRVLEGKEIGEVYNSDKDFDNFYEELKKGALPTTVAVNSFEAKEHFEKILAEEKEGDIIHLPLSSGLSVTYDNTRIAAEELNATLKGRKIHVLNSFSVTLLTEILVHKLLELRDKGGSVEDAIKTILNISSHLQAYVIVSDLFHLKRGGRISGLKAAIGSMLGIKPVIIVNPEGRLVINNRPKGLRNAVKYVLDQVAEYGEKAKPDFAKGKIYVVYTSKGEVNDALTEAVKAAYPSATVVSTRIGPIIGTHVGGGAAAVVFEGAPRLEK